MSFIQFDHLLYVWFVFLIGLFKATWILFVLILRYSIISIFLTYSNLKPLYSIAPGVNLLILKNNFEFLIYVTCILLKGVVPHVP